MLDSPWALHLSIENHHCCSKPCWPAAAVHRQEGSDGKIPLGILLCETLRTFWT